MVARERERERVTKAFEGAHETERERGRERERERGRERENKAGKDGSLPPLRTGFPLHSIKLSWLA